MAQALDSLSAHIDCDYAIDLRSFDAEQITAYQNSDAYYYDRPPPSPGFGEQITRWLMEKLGIPTARGVYSILDYVIYGLVLIALVMVISQLFKTDVMQLFYKPPPKSSIPYQALNENIHEMDFEQLLTQSIQQKKYRRATRLYYLKALKSLSDKGHIRWKLHKTNHDYQTELDATPLGKPFSDITYLFDYTWYGNFPVDEQEFELVQRDFKHFQSLVR